MAVEYSGAVVTLGIHNGSTYDTVAQVRDINGPSLSTDTIDVTSRDSSDWKEYLAGLRDGGEISLDLLFDPDTGTHEAASTGFVYLQDAGTVKQMQLGFPNSNTLTFTAIVTGVEFSAPLNDALTADVTLKVSGAITWA